MSPQEIIECIKSGEQDKALDELYSNYPAFRNTLKKAGGKRRDAEDIFQDALLIFIEKVTQPNFELKCSVNSFLFAICRNLSFEHFRKKGKEINIIYDVKDEDACDVDTIGEIIEQEKKYHALDKVLFSIGKKCMEILNLFYVRGLKMSSIAEEMGFKSEASAKTQKYKCIEKARKLSEGVLVELQTQLS